MLYQLSYGHHNDVEWKVIEKARVKGNKFCLGGALIVAIFD